MNTHPNPSRFVQDGSLVSTQLPNICVTPSKAFRYVGQFAFRLPNIAQGERYIFAEAPARKTKRLFIAQFETILPESAITYNYSFAHALILGGYLFKQNTFAFSNRDARQENPQGEAALTADFLAAQGYLVEDEWMMSRFVMVADVARKSELILFYVENVSASGHQLQAFYQNDEETMLWREISHDLTQRSLEEFVVSSSLGAVCR